MNGPVFSLRRRLLTFGLALLLSLIPAISASAIGEYPSPSGQVYVNDSVGVLSSQEKQDIVQIGSELEKKTGIQLVAAVVAATQGESIITYGLHLYKNWGLGEKNKDQSALILISVGDSQAGIESGVGLEPLLPKSKADEIKNQKMLPALKSGDYTEAILSGYKAAATQLYNIKKLPLPDSLKEKSGNGNIPLIIGASLLLLLLAITGGRFRAGKGKNDYIRQIFKNPFRRR